MVEWKEYISVESLTLAVAIATFIVTLLAYRHSRRNEKMSVKNLLATKQAQLKAMQSAYHLGVNAVDMGKMGADELQLRAEIEQLKKQL